MGFGVNIPKNELSFVTLQFAFNPPFKLGARKIKIVDSGWHKCFHQHLKIYMRLNQLGFYTPY